MTILDGGHTLSMQATSQATSLAISVLSTIETRIQKRHLLTHPFYQAWSAGELSPSSLQEYAKQYYRHVEAFPTCVSAVHSNCPSLPVRQYLLENLLEEERGEEHHPELWLRFAEALGAQRRDVLTAEPLPETSQLVETFHTLTHQNNYLAGITALLAYEAQIPAVSETKIDGLKQFYGVEDARGLSFFQVHLQADRFHAETARTILRDHLTDEDASPVISSCERALDALWGMLDGVQREYC